MEWTVLDWRGKFVSFHSFNMGCYSYRKEFASTEEANSFPVGVPTQVLHVGINYSPCKVAPYLVNSIPVHSIPWGWSGGAMVLGKTSNAGASYNLDYSRIRAYCTCSRCGWGCLDIFTLIHPFSPLSPSLWETVRYRLKYCLKGPLNPKQPTNQPNTPFHSMF